MEKMDHNDTQLAVKLDELNDVYNVSLELLEKSQDHDALLDALLGEYLRRLADIPGVKLDSNLEQYTDLDEKEKVRSLMMFAKQALLLKRNADISAEVQQKNEELLALTKKKEEANCRLENLNRQYMNMLGFVSHELRSPLISVLGFAELLEEGYLGSLSEEQTNSIQTISKVTRSLIEMTRNYLDLSKIENGELEMKWTSFNLHDDLLQELLRELEGQLGVRGMKINQQMHMDPADLKVQGDRDLLKVVFMNIFSNAVKYGSKDTVIDFRIENRKHEYLFSVLNRGKGVEKSKLDAIFNKFTHGVQVDTGLPKGTGLGLFNTQCILSAHGGTIQAESREGEWFRIDIQLPKSPDVKVKVVKLPIEKSGFADIHDVETTCKS